MNPLLSGSLAITLAVGLDKLIGDPRWLLHPVVVMGWFIQRLRDQVEPWAGDTPWKLRLAGAGIAVALISSSGLAGWGVERLAVHPWGLKPMGWVLLVIGLASALAGTSLRTSVMAILNALNPDNNGDLSQARDKLSWIVGRDVQHLDQQAILRAATESAAENAVDGLFAPLFWMGVGTWIWMMNPALPGPLSLAWMFKAASTMDSMLGYRTDRLRWLGTAGARLDDLLVWLPCRLVMLSLPLISCPWSAWITIVRASERDGAHDPSPNAGRSEAVYAHCVGVQLGGRNRYGDRWVNKPVLAGGNPPPQPQDVIKVLRLNQRLELCWISAQLIVASLVSSAQ